MVDKSNSSKKIKESKEKTKAILESDANSNYIVDILELSESEDEAVVVAFIRAVHTIFPTFLSRGKFVNRKQTSKNTSVDQKEDQKEDPEDIFCQWLHGKYLFTVERLLHFLRINESRNVKEFALCSLMKFVVAEGENTTTSTVIFPNNLFRQICDALCDGKYNMKNCIERFKEYQEYDDVRFFLLKNLAQCFQRASTRDCGEFLVENSFALLKQVNMKEKDEDLTNFFVKQENTNVTKDDEVAQQWNFCVVRQHRKVFSAAWLAFLTLPLTSEIHKKVLISLHTEVIPHMVDPKLLMDFLTDSYNIGGSTSLLALDGLFFLIHKYNLDYPEFFKKLYGLFEPSIFHVKYRARFFHLADLFLTSTHLPAYLVAAFAKRLSHLALSAPPSGAMLIIPFVCNLVKRHPSIKVLIHRKQTGGLLLSGDGEIADVISEDPYIPDEPDPAKSNALQSSLWELKTLQSHFYPGVSSLVELLEKPLNAGEVDITRYLDVEWDELFQKECKKVTEGNAHMEFQLPKGICSKAMADSWVLD